MSHFHPFSIAMCNNQRLDGIDVFFMLCGHVLLAIQQQGGMKIIPQSACLWHHATMTETIHSSYPSPAGLSDRIVGCRLRLTVGLEEEVGRPRRCCYQCPPIFFYAELVKPPFWSDVFLWFDVCGSWPWKVRWSSDFRNADFPVPYPVRVSPNLRMLISLAFSG